MFEKLSLSFGKLFQRQPRPLDNVTPCVQELFKLARKNADRLNHQYVGTEHLLFGLLDLSDGVGFTALKHLGVNPVTLRQALENKVVPGSAEKPAEYIPYTPRFKKALKTGDREAELMGLKYFGTEHLFLGLLQAGGLAAVVLKSQKVELAAAREAVRQILAANANSQGRVA